MDGLQARSLEHGGGRAALAAGGPTLLERVEAHSGEAIRRCFQCDKCATGCPLATSMDRTPNELFGLIQLGDGEAVFSSNTFWVCVSCYTCSVRCPNDIDIAGVMDALRELSLQEGHPPAWRRARDFHEIFLDCVRRSGRVSEFALMARYHLKLRKPFGRLRLGWVLFRKGRLELWSFRGQGLRRLFRRLKEPA